MDEALLSIVAFLPRPSLLDLGGSAYVSLKPIVADEGGPPTASNAASTIWVWCGRYENELVRKFHPR